MSRANDFLDGKPQPSEIDSFLGPDTPKPASAARKMGDLGIGFASGAVGAIKSIADAAGAGNKASSVLSSLNTGINDYLSPEAKADQQTLSAGMAEAKSKGFNWDGVKAGAKAFATAPGQAIAQGVGSVVPIIAGTAFAPGAIPAAAVGAGLGIAMGAGTAKGAIYDEIKKRGGTEEEAIKAQEYGGVNTDQIALGGALGAVDSLTGVSRAATGMVRGALGKEVVKQTATTAAERGIVGRAGIGALKEMPLEAAQGGQEQVAANIAAQRAGYEAGTWDNVASNATLEALASAGPGAMFGAMDTGNKQTPPPPPPPAPQPDQPAPPAGLLGNTPDPLISFPDGTVGRRSEVDAYVAGLPENEQPAARARLMGLAPQPAVPEPVAPSVQMGIDPAAGVISKVAAQAVDTGTVQEIQLNQAADEERMAYEQAMADQDQANAEQDSVDKPITSGPIAESQMSEEDKRAVLFSNQAVADGGRRHVGTQDGDILNGMGAPFSTRMAAARRANMEGKDWTIAPVFDGFVARRKDAFNGASDGVRGASAGSSEQGSDQSAPGVGLGAADGNGMGADARGRADDAVGESRQFAGGVDDTAVGRPGYDTPVEIDARVLQGLYEESKGEQLVNKPEKLEAWRNGTSKTDPSKFPVEIGFRDSDGGLDVNDGRHRIALAAERGEKVRAFIDGKDAEKLNALVNNVQNTAPAANEPKATASTGEAPAAVASDAAPTEGVPGSGSAPVESAGVEQAWADAPIENLHALIRQKKASAAQMRRNSKAAKLESERAAWLEQAKATEGFVSQLQAVVSARENPIIQPEKQEQPTSALPEQLSNPEQKDNEVSQSAQPGALGQGAGVSQPTQTAPKTAKAGSKVGPASLGSAKADMDHLFGVDAKRAKAIERIAKGTAYFGTNLKAAQFIKENGLNDTHEAVRHESGANRWDVREKAPVKDSLPVQSERETRIASALASGGHVVGFDLRDRTGMRLMGLTPEEFATIPADKVRAKPSAEAARTDSTTKGNEDGTQAPETQQAEAQQSQEQAPGQPVAAEKPSLKKAQAERKAKKEAEKTSDEGLTSAQYQMRHVGAKAFADGSKRVPPSFMAAASQREWLAGWDTANAAAPVASKPEIVVDKAEMRPYRKPDGSVGYEAVPIENATPAAEKPGTVNVPPTVAEAFTAQMQKQKGRITRLKNEAEKAGSLEDKKAAQLKVTAAEATLRQMRLKIFDAEDAAVKSVEQGIISPFKDFADLFPSAAEEIAKLTGQNDELDAEMQSYEAKVDAKAPQTPADKAQAATETVATPDAKTALSEREKAAKAKMFNALGKLAHLAGKNTRMNWTQEEEQQLLPIVIELFDGAMELGAVSFQQAVAYVRDFITTNLDSETADAIPFDTLQGAYISVAGRHKDKPVTPKKEVVGYESLDELALAKPAASADTPTEDTPNEPANPNQQDPQALEPVPAAENRGPESSGRVERGSAGRRARRKPDDSGLAEPGVSGTRSGGSGSTTVRAPAPRAGKRGRLGESGAGANGSAVPEAGSTQPVDLFSAPTEPVSAGNIQATNFRITEDLRLGQGGEAEKFRDNLAAIRTLKAIESEGRRATSAEQRTLARYVGWGGLASAFPNPESKAWKDDWKARGAELRELLTDKEYDLARRSTLDSHYTSQTVVTAMWDAARRLGFKGGLAAETSMGIGNFMGLMPEDVAGNTRFLGVEYDSLTARMAGLLYPQATVLHSGLQKVPMPDGAFDLNIGNPPFGDQSLRFQFKPEINRVSIHNQFFLAGVDALKPGGLQINVVSRYLLDAMDKTTRTMLAKKAKLVAAIRLPDTAFKENARTSVVTDIVILQRLTPAEESNMQAVFQAAASKPEKQHDKEQERKALAAQVPAWVEVATVPDPLGGAAIPVNSYFAANPGNILGTLERSGKMQFKNDITVRPGAGDLSELLAKAVARLPEGIMQRDQEAIQASIARHQGLSDALRISLSGQEAGSIAITPDGGLEQVIERETPEGDYELAKRAITPQSPWSESLYQDATGAWYTIEAKLDAEGKPEKVTKNGKATNLNVYERKVFASEADIPEGMLLGQAKFDRLAKLVKLRDLMVNQISLETEDAPTLRMEGNRKKLAAAYKDFVGTEGFISKPANSALVANMPDGALVQALELSYRKAISLAQAKKMGEKARPEQADPAPILTERVIPKYEPPTKAATPADALSIVMSEAGRVDIERMASLLGKTEAEVTAEMFDNADKPLIFKDPETSQWVTRNEYLTGQVKKKLHAAQAAGLQKHIAELEAVQPEPWGAENVTVLLGATFVPPQIYADFILHMTGAPAKVSFSQVTNSYSVSPSGNATAAKNDEWGAEGISIANMINAMLNSTGIKVTTTDADGNTVLDKERTELANLKARQIASEFTDWAFADGERRKTLVGLFNEKYNTRVNRQHDGSHLTLPGKVPDAIISMRRHQKNAIWRGISERFMLLDHVVGAGKTFTAIARAMERRRMGLSRKPAIIVPNHMVEQFTSDVYRLYPGAKVLAAGKADFEKKRRRKVFAKIASGDWDVVIIPHSSFGFIGIAPETEERYLEQELVIAEQAIKDAWEESDDAPGGRRTPFNVKQAERLRDKITARMEGLKGKDRKDRLLTFEQMGIDDLTVDEAHEFKNLFYSSRLTNVKGMGNPSGSQKAFDLYSKVRVLRESPTGTVTFMTGTPISNSAVEMFTMMRYLAADELRELGLEHFDAWRAQFVSTDAGWEPTETGRLKEVNRLGRSWSNMRSLMDLYYSFTDSVGNEDIKKAYAEDNKGKQFPIPKVKGGDRQSVVVQPTPEQVTLLTDTMNEFDALPGIKDPYERNIARLQLMDRARKLSLDVRAAVPGHPSKEVGGKLDKISDEVKRIYDQWSDDKGTQLVFLDRSVPKAKGDDKIIKDYDALIAERNKAISANDEEALRKATESLDKFDSNEVEELRASQAGGWNAYQQIKDNLIARGIPAGEIRFVQEANNDAQKQALFDQVKAGEVRVLIGSTPRMGAGTNVQDRLVALHHADVTWKPSDIEQREGRVIRQGNKLLDKYGIDNFEVEILAYATERTIDAKMWSLNSSKLKTINAIRNYDGSFSMDFDDDDSVSMAELAALASGNPMLLERVKLDSEINNLELLRKQHQRKTWGYVSRLEDAEKAIERATPDSERFTKLADQATIGATELAEDLAARSVTVEGESFTSYAEAAKAVTAEIVKQQAGDDKAKFSVKVGERRLTSQNGALDALSDALGDADPFLATVNGATYRGRTALAREVARLATDAAPNLTVGDSKVLATGKMLGFTFESSLSRSQYGGDYMVDMALVDADGKTVDAVTGRGQADTKFVTSSLTNPLSKLSDYINPERFKSRARGAVQDAERAKRELPELREKAALPFAKEGDLDEKRARLSQVIAELSTDKAPAAPEAEPEGETPAMSRARPVFSRGAQVQANESVETIAMAIASKWEGSPEIVVAFDMDDPIIPEKVRKEDQRQRSGGATGTPEGFYYKGVVYLMSSKLGTPNDVARVLFHEALGHAGLRGAFGGSLEPILREVSVMRRAEVDAKLKQYGLKGINKIDRLIAAEEVLAEMAQTRPDIGFVKRAIAAIRTWLRQNVPGFNSLRLTDDELIRSFIIPARDYVTKSGVRSASLSGDVRTSSNQSTADSGRSFTNRFSNLAQSLAFKEKGIDSLDVPSQRVMLSHVFSAMQDFKIADSVISLLPIDMVNILTGEKFSTKKVLHNEAMLKNLLSVSYGNQSIPLAANSASALIEAVAYVTANHGGGANFGQNSLTWLPAMRAIEANSLGFGDGRSTFRTTANNSTNGLVNAAGGSIKFSGAMGTLDDRHVVTPISDNVLGTVGGETPSVPPTVSKNRFSVNKSTARRFVEQGGGPKGGLPVRVEPTFSRGKDGKSIVLSKHGFFNAWPKFNSWTRAEYNDVVSLLPQEYRSDAHRAEPLSPKDRDTHTAAALSEIKSLNQSIGDKGFGVDSLGNLVGDMRNGITTGDLLRAADIADVNGLGVFVTGVKTDSIQVLLDAGFVSEFGIGGVLARVTKSNNPVRPMASGVMNNTAYGTMMSYKPKGFAAPMFSRSIGETLTTAANNVHDVNLPAGYTVGDLLKSAPGKVSWWHKTVGTMYNLAERSPQFKRVFDGVQNFINDVSYYATEAADLAPNILPKLETWKDIGKSPLSAEDTKAISAPIFEGTLTWARDEQGKPIKIEALEAQAATLTPEQKAQRLLRNDKVSDQVLKMWQGLPLDQYESIIEGKYERDMLKAGVVWTPAELRAKFNLTGEKQSDGTWDGQIGLYQEFRKATDKSLTNLAISDMLRFGGKDVEPIRNRVLSTDNVVQAGDMLRDYLLEMSDMDPARKDVLLDTANKMVEKSEKAKDLIERGYAPLSRYGQFTLDVVSSDGERVYFGMFESKIDAARMARKMELEYPDATITRGTVSDEEYKLFAGVSPETLELFGDMLGLEAQGDSAASKAFQTYLKLAKSNRSSMKRMIQRKGIAGFSEDSGRVLAGFVYSNARQTASNLHMGEMTDAANEVAKTQGELKDQAVRLVDYVKNPREEAQAFRGLLFAQYIGGSVASAMVNMTQPFAMTFPWLSQYTSVADASKQMASAMKDANRKHTGDTRLDAALKRAEEDGTVSPQEVHQLMQQSQGRGALRSGDGTKAGDVMAAANNALSRFSLGWGKLFSLAEQFNRRATFIAAYRTAVAKGIDAPEAFARKAIAETQGIYNKGNKPNWARGAVGSTLFTFKQYSIAYVEMLHRMATQGGPEGKKAAMLALAVLFLMSGAGGMPGGDDLDDLISGIMQRLGYNYDSKTKRQEFFASIVGEGGAQFLERGVSGLPGVPIDVSGRLGMGNLIPGTGLLVKKVDHTRDLAEIAGPGGDFVKRGFDAAGKLLDGNVFGANGAAATVAPKAIQNLYQSYDMANMGMYRDAKGMKVLDTGAADSVLKAIGFQPNDVKKVQDASFETQRMIGLNKLRETEIANRWALGIFEKDSDKVKAAREELAQWNATNPESPIRINFKQILQRVQKMNQTKAERITATAPKEIRADVRRALDVQ